MYSKTPKILHKILGKSIIQFVVELARDIGSQEIILVVGKNGQQDVRKIIGKDVQYAIQEKPKGSGDAAKKGIALARYDNILILYGDVPLLTKTTISKMINYHRTYKATLTILTCAMTNPFGYGRIVRDKMKKILGIVEQSDATVQEQKIKEINTGVYYGERRVFLNSCKKITTQNRQGEYYLTDIVQELIKQKEKVVGFKIRDEQEILGINSRFDLARVRDIVKQKWFEDLMQRGVYIEDPSTTNIDLTGKIGNFVHIRPFTIIEGDTKIKDNETIGPFVWIKDGVKIGKKLGLR